MIPLLTRAAVRALDQDAIQRLRVQGLVLMENAGAGATEVLLKVFGDAARRCVIIGGVGQNGGDAWVVARQLLVRGFVPACFLVGDPARVQGDARANWDALRALGVEPTICGGHDFSPLEQALRTAQVAIDGLFGTGLDRDITGTHAAAIEVLNRSGVPVFALDLPSGIDADTGQVRGIAVRARCTATFAAHKRGLHQFPGAEFAGEVHCVSIGVPVTPPFVCGVIEPSDVPATLPRRAADAHKGTNGRVLIIAGSAGKTGAAMLAALSALRAGGGLVTIATDTATQRALEQKVLEVMTAALSDADMLSSALSLARTQDTILVGPGLGLSAEKMTFARELALKLPNPCVLDADALTAIGRKLQELRSAAGPRVLTPHPGEASRLLGISIRDIEADRYEAARSMAEQSGQVVVLKGARTIVVSPHGDLRVCRSGTPALGTAGTGDVLGGAIAALCGSLTPFEAAWVGVELHALAGALAARSDRGLLAGEVAAHLPDALEQCRLPAAR